MEEIERMLLEAKDTSELMIDLAYSSILYNNHDIAEEVMLMEEMVDQIVHDIQEKAIGRVLEDGDVSKAMVVISLANSVEEISDAAMEIADVVLRDVTAHPVFQMSVRDSDSIISTAKVDESSDLARKSIPISITVPVNNKPAGASGISNRASAATRTVSTPACAGLARHSMKTAPAR